MGIHLPTQIIPIYVLLARVIHSRDQMYSKCDKVCI